MLFLSVNSSWVLSEGPPPVPLPVDTVPDLWEGKKPQTLQYVVPASRYYATGGTAADHEYKGVDSYLLINISGMSSKWESTYRIDMYHTGDWVVYHIPARNVTLDTISIACKNPYTPSVGTPVQVYAKAGQATPPLHDTDLHAAGWSYIGEFTILPPGNWSVYGLNVGQIIPPSDSYSFAIQLKEGEIGPEDPKTSFREDRNLYIAWVKIG